jgi:type IV pilus assembly protein PilV
MHAQDGMTLIEVLVALLILSVGLLGAAAVQLNALKYTDSSLMTTQASFIAYDMLDRIRASTGVLDQDLRDFTANIESFGGASATGRVRQGEQMYSIRIEWDDSRAAGAGNSRRILEVSSRTAAATP